MTKHSFFKAWENHAHKHANPLAKQAFAWESKTHLADFAEHFPFVVFVINHVTSRYEFFSKNAKAIIGYTSEEMMAGGLFFGMSLCEENHRAVIAHQIIPCLFRIFKEFADKKELERLTAAYNFKYRRKDGAIRWALQQISVIESDETGGPLRSIVFMEDITARKGDDKVDFSVSSLSMEGYYEPFYSASYSEANRPTLTSRERDIVSLINAGKTSIEMAEKLHLSMHTVKTHRKNILEKMKAKNTAHLLDICRKKGLL